MKKAKPQRILSSSIFCFIQTEILFHSIIFIGYGYE